MSDEKKLTHYDDAGNVRMVEVTDKKVTRREAVATCRISLSKELVQLIRANGLKKGNPLEVARIAAIMAAKRTHELIPLCHSLLLTKVDVQIELLDDRAEIESTVVCEGKTGVEMEALTASSVAALTIFDMCKAVDKNMVISEISLLRKSGGQSGFYQRKQ